MSKIEISCHGQCLAIIELRDHPFVEKWFDHWKFINEKYPLCFLNDHLPLNSLTPNLNTEEIIEAVTTIKETGLKLNNMTGNYFFPYTEENFPDTDVFLQNGLEAQLYLNEFHRYFTNGIDHGRTASQLASDGIIKNASMREEWFFEIQKINQEVHKLDVKTVTPNLRNILDEGIFIKRFNVWYNLYGSSMYLEQGTHCPISYDECYDAADDSKEWHAWIKTDLLGKDYMTAFINHDDPTEWDIQYLNTYTGMFDICINDQTQVDFCKSNSFNSWLENYGIEYNRMMCGIPLGKIVYKDETNIHSIWNQHKSNIKINAL